MNYTHKKCLNIIQTEKYQPLITVIVAVRNRSDTLKRCIESVVSQKYPYKELIIMDGGSTDGSLSIINSYVNEITYWESKSDKGVYHAWNKALDHAKGEWICFLGADDFFWNSNVFNKIVDNMRQALKQNTRYIYGKFILLSKEGEMIAIEGKPWHDIRHRIRQFAQITHSGTFHNKDLFIQHGNFDESFKIAGDYEFLLRELKNRNAYFAENVVVAGISIGGISRNLTERFPALNEALRARNRHSNSFPWLIYFMYIQLIIYWAVGKIFGKRVSSYMADFYRLLFGKRKAWSNL